MHCMPDSCVYTQEPSVMALCMPKGRAQSDIANSVSGNVAIRAYVASYVANTFKSAQTY